MLKVLWYTVYYPSFYEEVLQFLEKILSIMLADFKRDSILACYFTRGDLFETKFTASRKVGSRDNSRISALEYTS